MLRDFCRSVAEVAIDYGRIARKSMMEFGRGGAYVPARVALQGRIHHLFPSRMMRVCLLWKRRCANVRAGRLRVGR